ncbi:MAG: hypothetical protein WAQ74_00730 [Kiritimatiellia bacterium]|jgi:hypothetical protein|nr:hypothetical protein [Lentisphaerota bacterium]
MKRIFALLALSVSSCLAIDNPITAEQLATWLDYSGPVTMERRDAGTNALTFLPGKLVGLTGYATKEHARSVYYVALYEGGTFLAGRRAETEKRIEERIANPASGTHAMRPSIQAIRIRNGGRKVFFDDMFLGQGGGGEIAFTTLPGQPYDLVVAHIAADDDSTKEGDINPPPLPQNTLSDIYDMIEGAILNELGQEAGPGCLPQGVESAEP